MQQPSSFFSRPLRFALAMGLLIAAPAASIGACGSGNTDTTSAAASSTSGGVTCEGGVIVNGVCSAKCVPGDAMVTEGGKCLVDNVCVANACALKCDSLLDCAQDGTQDCVAAKDDDGVDVQVCLFNGKANGIGFNCPFGAECGDPAVYNLFACPDGSDCDPAQCGGQGCTLDEVACGDATDCKVGKCPDSTACTVPSCAMNECKGMTCAELDGEADATSYCTAVDCKADADCPGGYYCGIERDPHEICGSPKGSESPCVDPANFADNGATYQEGPISLLRNVCLKRDVCASCETDVDCSLIAGHRCVALGDGKICALGCVVDDDCPHDYACDAAQAACVPRFGACKGAGNFCDPCQNDLDCGPGTGTVACVELSLQKFCLDVSTNVTCTTDNDCPVSAGGKHGLCLDENFGVSQTSAQYHTCYAPFNGSTGFDCW